MAIWGFEKHFDELQESYKGALKRALKAALKRAP